MKTAATTRRTAGYRRRNFTLRAETTRLLDRLPPEVNRSRLVDEAIRAQLASASRAWLRELVEAEAADNLVIDNALLDEALAVSGERTKTAAVTKALEQFIACRRQKRIRALFGQLEWNAG